MHKGESSSDVMSPPSMRTSTARLINTSGNMTMVGSNQTSVGCTSDDSFETTVEPRGINSCLKGYFCSDVAFILSNKVLSDTEIKFLGKWLGFMPTPLFINESDFKRDSENFARKMRCKWYFRNGEAENFRYPALKMFWSQLEGDIFSVLPGNTSSYNLAKTG